MNPLDLLNPDNYDWSDEDWIVTYGEAITDFVTESHSVKQIIADERKVAYEWLEELIKKLVEPSEELADGYFYEWEVIEAPIIVDKLFDKIKKLEGEK
tara:strand:- start:411 stop:704 length:294 start_codon:yes stop_codon:yes gene_type:complete